VLAVVELLFIWPMSLFEGDSFVRHPDNQANSGTHVGALTSLLPMIVGCTGDVATARDHDHERDG
jgi:hypothetical protein